jgi:hypothetical protein
MTTAVLDHLMTPHLSDGVILALTDGERGADFHDAERHLEQCDVCSSRRLVLASYSHRVRESLAAIPRVSVSVDEFRRGIAVRARRATPVWRRPAWQAAAVVMILAGAAVASPVRSWIQALIAHRAGSTAQSPQSTGGAATQPRQQREASISFAPAGPTFIVRFDSMPLEGLLSADTTSETEITARLISVPGTTEDAFVVLPGELRVRNRGSSRASYGLSLPPLIRRFRVTVAGQRVFDGPPPAVVPLRRPQ